MNSERRQLRGVVLAEDKRTERFFRELLRVLGFDSRSFRFDTAPSGRGAADAWVARRYPEEMKVLRSKSFQKGLRLIAVRDGDALGPDRRKEQLDESLRRASMDIRSEDDKVATPVPTRNIESWLLFLLTQEDVEETEDYKREFESRYRGYERTAIREAAAAWKTIGEGSPCSVQDGNSEMLRVEA